MGEQNVTGAPKTLGGSTCSSITDVRACEENRPQSSTASWQGDASSVCRLRVGRVRAMGKSTGGAAAEGQCETALQVRARHAPVRGEAMIDLLGVLTHRSQQLSGTARGEQTKKTLGCEPRFGVPD